MLKYDCVLENVLIVRLFICLFVKIFSILLFFVNIPSKSGVRIPRNRFLLGSVRIKNNFERLFIYVKRKAARLKCELKVPSPAGCQEKTELLCFQNQTIWR